MNIRHLTALGVMTLGLLCSTKVLGWGQEGHSIVGELAQRRLTPDAMAAVSSILGPGVSLASVANWADDDRAAGHQETFRWHFVDIPATAGTRYDAARDCKLEPGQGDCVIAALDRLSKILADPTVSNADKRGPLMFMVHFMGDMSQPLHCSERDLDQGGNTYFVTFNGNKEKRPTAITFHSLWDTVLILERIFNWGAMVTDLESTTIPSMNAAEIATGSVVDWANECHDVGVSAYAALGPNSPRTATREQPFALAMPYADATHSMMKQQLAKGGIRLAQLLNNAFASK